MSPLSVCFGILLLVVGGFARSDEQDSGERLYHVPDLAHDGVKHDFSSSVEASPEEAPSPKMKRSFSWSSDENSREDSEEAQIVQSHAPVSGEIPEYLWRTLPLFLFHFGEEEAATPTTDAPNFDKFFYPFSSRSDEDNRLSNDVNEVTFYSHDEGQAPDAELIETTPAPQDSDETLLIDHPAIETEQVTSTPALDSDDLSLFYHSLHAMFEPQVPQQESSDVIIMVNDVKIQVTRQQKVPTLPIPYYYMASRS